MTVNDQHIVLVEKALKNVTEVCRNLESVLQILQNYPSKKDREARHTSLLLSELSDGVIVAMVSSGMLERTLRYARIGAPDAQGDADTD